jgi:tetratricopeptide (TPR) repeat protein
MSSQLEKYELILSADPRSRIFVELGRALIERGDHERAIQVIQAGLVHHPESVQARVLLGRAYLSLHRPADAVEPLEAALRLAPADARIALLLDRAQGLVAASAPSAAPDPAPASPGPPAARAAPPAAGAPAPPVLARASAAPPPAPEAASGSPPDPEVPASQRIATPIPTAIEALLQGEDLPEASFEPTGSIPLDAPLPEHHRPAPRQRRPGPPPRPAPAPPEEVVLEEQPAAPADPPAPAGEAPPPAAAAEQAPDAAPPPAPPPAAVPPPIPPPPAEEAGPLKHLPREEAREPRKEPTLAGLPLVSEEAARIAAKYEHELRKKMSKDQVPAERSLRPQIAMVVLAAVAVASAGTFWLVRHAYRAQEAEAGLAAARAGLARDTLGSLQEAARALDEARAQDPALQGVTALQAEVAALLWADFADEKALERARRLASAPDAGEGALVARYLAAPDAAERDRAAAELVAAAPGGGPLAGILAAGVLRGRGDREGARRLLESAARGTPPMLRALADLGDMTRAGGDLEEALHLYRLALQAHPTHPRSVLGSAEVRLALSRSLEDSLKEVEVLHDDPHSPPPGPERLRAELVHAKLLFALGRQDDAVMDLGAAGGRFPGRPEVPAAVAEMEMARSSFDRAEVAAERAASLAPHDPAMQELLARVRLGRGRYRELLADTEGTTSRPIRIIRAQARIDLSDWDRARTEIEATRRDGRVSADAAAWLAYCEVATGRRSQALVILQALESSKDPPAMARVARGRLLAADGKRADAEKVLRAAAAAPGAPLLAQVELARAVRAQGRAAEAQDLMAAALARDPFHAPARLERARARIDLGDLRGAAADARKVLEDHPSDPEAKRILGSVERPAAPAPRPARRRR